MKSEIKLRILFCIILLFGLTMSIRSFAYKQTDPSTVHQHITKEALEIWNYIPYEIKDILLLKMCL